LKSYQCIIKLCEKFTYQNLEVPMVCYLRTNGDLHVADELRNCDTIEEPKKVKINNRDRFLSPTNILIAHRPRSAVPPYLVNNRMRTLKCRRRPPSNEGARELARAIHPLRRGLPQRAALLPQAAKSNHSDRGRLSCAQLSRIARANWERTENDFSSMKSRPPPQPSSASVS
ncbi:unnamed protein product, partial [Nesidiocoris tenuis]